MDIARVGVIATFFAFQFVGMTTGRKASATLNRGKFLVHLGVLWRLFGSCVVLGFLVSSAGRYCLKLHVSCLGRHRKYPEAEVSGLQAVEIALKLHGKETPEVALEENNLGSMYFAMGRLNRAEALARNALAVVERGTGPIPPVLPDVLDHPAVLCKQTGRAEETIRVRERARGFRPGRP